MIQNMTHKHTAVKNKTVLSSKRWLKSRTRTTTISIIQPISKISKSNKNQNAKKLKAVHLRCFT